MSINQGPSFKANESISAFVAVAVNASSTANDLRVELADTSTCIVIGIIQDNVSTDGSAEVVTLGRARALLATTTAAGDLMTWQTATGQLMPVASTSTITARLVATALCAGTAGSIIPVLVNPSFIPNI
jgi:hypothetical protein